MSDNDIADDSPLEGFVSIFSLLLSVFLHISLFVWIISILSKVKASEDPYYLKNIQNNNGMNENYVCPISGNKKAAETDTANAKMMDCCENETSEKYYCEISTLHQE